VQRAVRFDRETGYPAVEQRDGVRFEGFQIRGGFLLDHDLEVAQVVHDPRDRGSQRHPRDDQYR
jgi:hypothetical protein